jgi:phytol kinase
VELLPPPFQTACLLIAGAGLAMAAGLLCGWLKLRRGVRTNFTRKIFHFTIFTGAMALHVTGGWAWVNAYALGVVTVILLGVWRGAGNPIFEGMARERDEPHRAFYVVVPLLTTALGGLSSNWLAGDFALVGYLVTGWGDAIGEPAGAWLGRHEYRVPTLRRVPCTRTLEGSAAVGIAAWIAAVVSLMLGFGTALPTACLFALAIALATVVIEAVSPHGSDNFTTMLGASLLAMWLAT